MSTKSRFPRGSEWRVGAMLLVAMGLAHGAEATIRINELMASNASSGADEEGDREDWIELYNAGSEWVELAGWGLSDNPDQPFKWVFATGILEPGGYLLVWASGKDRQASGPAPGLRREVYWGIPGTTIAALTGHETFPENPDEVTVLADLFEAPVNVGFDYGQRVSGRLVAPESGNYRFWIASDDHGLLLLSPNPFPTDATPIASVPGWTAQRQWNKYPQQVSAPIPLVAGQHYYIEALMKQGGGGDNLAVAWERPDGAFEGPIPAHHFLRTTGEFHTNFAIAVEGEPIVLTRPDGTTADFVPAVRLRRDVSYGRSVSDAQQWVYYERGTPGRANAGSEFVGILHDPPSFSVAGGFHDAPFELVLAATDQAASVVYTLDGSTPLTPGVRTYGYKNRYPRNPGDAPGELLTGAVEAFVYEAPLAIVDRSPLPNRIAQRNTTFDTSANHYAPTGPIFKATTVRARQVREGFLPGPVATHTYFVGPGTAARYALPILAFAVDEAHFFDHDHGLYNAGVDFETWRATSNGLANGASPANYRRRGEAAQYRAAMELFMPEDGRVLEREVDFRIHGGWSRAWAQKSLRLYARSVHLGGQRIEYPLFPGLVGRGTGEPVVSFRRLILRNSGNDYPRTRLRDALIQDLVGHYPIDRQAYRPAVHFVNGEYWGIINLRERIDRFFIADHHGVDPDAVAILNNNAHISEGRVADRADFLALRQFIATHDMADPAHYATAAAQMDMDNFLLYHAIQIYIGNRDWPYNNIDFWRANAPGLSPATDGRWRWILFDTDFGLGMYDPPTLNTLEHATSPNHDWATLKLRRLLTHPGFRQRFLNAMGDLMAATFHPERVAARADAMAAVIAPYTAEHSARWRDHGSWSVAPIKNYAAGRPQHMRAHLQSYFSLGGVSAVTLDVAPPQGGHLRFNTLELGPGRPGLVDSEQPFPWSGLYFDGVPVVVTAVPAEGWRFAGWVERPDLGAIATVELDPAGGWALTASFEPVPVVEPPVTLHLWQFDEVAVGPPTATIGGGLLAIEPGPLTVVELNAAAQGFTSTHLRINHPLGATMCLALPTPNYEAMTLELLTRRSGEGAGALKLLYTIDGESWIELREDAVFNASPQTLVYPFTTVEGAADNPHFAVRLEFGTGDGGSTGNIRFDDITLTGQPIPGRNFPPVVVDGALPAGKLLATTVGTAASFDLSAWFTDPEEDPLSFAAIPNDGAFVAAEIDAATLNLTGLAAGETTLLVTANDGSNDPIGTALRVLVYPAPHPVAQGRLRFEGWPADRPAMTFPDHMIFLQGNENDSSLATVLDRAYAIPLEDAASPDDAAWPYAAASRTRIEGRGAEGVAFINTGRGRDLGGALLALDTRGVTAVQVAFTVGTVLPNARVYAWRLQYRVGRDGAFSDLPDEHGAPIEYVRAPEAGHAIRLGPVALPAAALDHPEVHLLWRYHRLEGTSGQRAMLRLDDIVVGEELSGYEKWRDRVFPDPEVRADPALSGPMADPFGVGLTNLERYAFGIDDLAAAAARRPRLVAGPGGAFAALRVPFAPLGDDVAWRVEASIDLHDWGETLFDSTWPDADELVETLGEGWFEVVDPWDGSGGRRFHRVRVWWLESSP